MTTGAYEIRRASIADANGVVSDEKSVDIQPGEWCWVDKSVDNTPYLLLYFKCADCKQLGTLWRRWGIMDPVGHLIDAVGNVFPSIGCGYPGCGFHTQPTKLLNFVDRRLA